jgi:hypothetical protein
MIPEEVQAIIGGSMTIPEETLETLNQMINLQ